MKNTKKITPVILTMLQQNAAENYANYVKNLSPLALEFHNQLHSNRTILRNHYLSVKNASANKEYRTKSACESAKRASMQPEYKKACDYFTLSSPTCLAIEAAEYYSERIDNVVTPALDALNAYCKQFQHETVYQKILELSQNCKDYLLTKFSQILTTDSAYYTMDSFEDYLKMTKIEKHDSRLEDENFFWRLLDAIVSDDAITYTFSSDAIGAIAQMERDLERLCEHFYIEAHSIYEDYIEKIVLLVDSIGHGLPEFEDNERINGYLKRLAG